MGLLDRVNARWVEADHEVTDSQWKNTRLIALGLLLLGPHLPRLGAVADVPDALINSRLRFPAGFLATGPSALLIALALATVVSVGLALGGFRVRIFGTAAALLLLVGNSILFSVENKIVHHQWVMYVVFVMSLTIWSGRDRVLGVWSPRLLLSWLIAWGLMTSALVKVRGGWLNLGQSVVRSQLDVQAVAQGRFPSVAQVLRDLLGESFLWEFADYATVGLELGLVCLLYTSPSPRDLSTSRMPSSA